MHTLPKGLRESSRAKIWRTRGVSKGEWDWRKHFRHRQPLGPRFPGRKKQRMFGGLGEGRCIRELRVKQSMLPQNNCQQVIAGWFCYTRLGREAGNTPPTALGPIGNLGLCNPQVPLSAFWSSFPSAPLTPTPHFPTPGLCIFCCLPGKHILPSYPNLPHRPEKLLWEAFPLLPWFTSTAPCMY